VKDDRLTEKNDRVADRRFPCDEIPGGVGRWLRSAGYDRVIATGGLPDRGLARLCTEEHRLLLTKDRRLAAAVKGVAPVVLVAEGRPTSVTILSAAAAGRERNQTDRRHRPDRPHPRSNL
jgi:uncharacterized protein with PIN domain